MKKLKSFTIFFVIFFLLIPQFTFAQVIKPKARGTPSQGPTIDQAQKEEAMGPKARVAVTRFEDKSAKGSAEIGTGMAEMLANALFATNRYILLERQNLDDVMHEQDLGASGRVRQETAAQIGDIEGADLLIMGTVTEFEPGASGMGGEGESSFQLPGRITRRMGDVLGGVKAGGGVTKSHVALIEKVVDAKTGRRLASEQVEGTATDIAGMTGLSGGVLSGAFSGYSKTPMEKAIRVCIEEAVKLVVAKTPKEYFRVSASPQPKTAPATPGPTPPPPQKQQTGPAPAVSSIPPKPSAGTGKVVYVKWPQVSLREGPGTNFKPVAEVKKGIALEIMEETGHWYRLRLEDGQEGWVGKATTSETP